MKTIEAIKKRQSVRKFSSKKPGWRDIVEAIHSARHAPMAGGIFSLKFLIVDDKETIEKIAKWSEQNFIADAKYVVVFVSDEEKVKNLYKELGKTFVPQQAGAAIENFLLHLTDAKLSSCWVGYFNENKIKTLLKIPDDKTIEALFPIGYADKSVKPKKEKAPPYDVMYFNEWGNKRMRKIEKIESRGPEGY